MPAPPDNPLLRALNLHHSHAGAPALAGVHATVRAGEILAVTGPRASGKTTLLRCLAGRLRPDEGEVWFDEIPLHALGPGARERLRRERYGRIGPDPLLLPELSVWENAALPLLALGAGRRAAKSAAREWLDRLDLGALARKRPRALTRAQCQHVALARALVHEPAVVLADEPTAPLHRADAARLLRTLTTAARSHGITVVLATHDLDVAEAADRRLALLDGRPADGAGDPHAPEDRPACSLSV
ncbi:ABC transporter ATP-binding protein [Streptomyces sp. BI20]|uniref:ABC transporter ATP-binding protein n=1 Tax=Streptomyces sp. BI20 TaxID=3403460 RepID=UPI003C7233D9